LLLCAKIAHLALIGVQDRDNAERPTPNVEISMHRKRPTVHGLIFVVSEIGEHWLARVGLDWVMKGIQSYNLIKPEDLHWRPSNLMKIPNADYLERTGSANLGARLCSLQRLQLTEHGGDQFADSRMNVHGALNHRVWRVGVHDVEERMNYLVGLDPQERRAKDLFRFGVHQNFHESLRLAFLHRTADSCHRTLSN
jgi:hypothetical protein